MNNLGENIEYASSITFTFSGIPLITRDDHNIWTRHDQECYENFYYYIKLKVNKNSIMALLCNSIEASMKKIKLKHCI